MFIVPYFKYATFLIVLLLVAFENSRTAFTESAWFTVFPWFFAIDDFCLILTQILLLWFILGYCDTTREIDTKRTISVDDFEVNDSVQEPLSTEASHQMPTTNYFALEAVSKGISDGLQKKKKVHGHEYS